MCIRDRVKDVRIFVNTIDHAIRLMTDNGVPATAHREERDLSLIHI